MATECPICRDQLTSMPPDCRLLALGDPSGEEAPEFFSLQVGETPLELSNFQIQLNMI